MLDRFVGGYSRETDLGASTRVGVTLLEILDERAALTPDRTAFIFLKDGNQDEQIITYGQLASRSRAIGARLLEVARPGDRALINHHPGLDYLTAFFGCLYAGVAAVPVYPPRFNQKMDRLLSIIGDVSPKACLTSRGVLDSVRPAFEKHPQLESTEWITTDNIEENAVGSLPKVGLETNAFIQYTSGSTSQPKGVVLSHQNIISNVKIINECSHATPDSVGMVWLPPYHDMGLIGGILAPLYGGFMLVLMSPFAFLQRPHRWLRAMSRYGGTMSSAPNFAYDLCVHRVSDKQMEDLDLSRWEVAFCGAEPIHAEVLRSFSERFKSVGFKHEAFYPCYGMAESTLILSGGDIKAAPVEISVDKEAFEKRGEALPPKGTSKAIVGCGSVFDEHKLAIVDPETFERCPDGKVGEIWFSGPSVAQGYWKQPELSESVFEAKIVGDDSKTPYLRTGDLGFLKDKELFVTGRIKDLLILRGKNFYPHDIERSVEQCHPLLKRGACAAFAVEGKAGEQLVVIQEVQRKARPDDFDGIVSLISQRVLEDHGINPAAVSLIRANSIPLTSSGKIQRSASRKLFLENELQELKRVNL